MQGAACHLAILDSDREVNQARRSRIVFQEQGIERAHGVEKFRGPDVPTLKINASSQLDGLEHLVEQQGAGQYRKSGEMPREGRMVCGDSNRAMHFHGESSARNRLSAK